MIVPTLCVGTHSVTLCVTLGNAERPWLHSHAERGNDQCVSGLGSVGPCRMQLLVAIDQA
ncbi:hypothetical protein EUX58_21015 [Pseudomonas sp. 770NI]|nr:hypothetical protein EUX58_21015 [Pseudomonas sp. 770NI]